MKSSQTNVLRLLRQIVVSPDVNLISANRPAQESRRQFIRQLAAATAGTVLSDQLFACRSAGQPKIAIIGAGMAGLTAAYYLEKAGLRVELFESDSRVGGRVRSAQNLLATGIVTELGGEFIDSHHTDIMTLCRAFDLPLLDTKAPTERQLIRTRYVFGGQHISEPDIIRAFTPFAERIRRDGQHLAGSSAQKNLAISQLDRLSIDAYLAQLGMSGWLSALISTSFTSEFGLSAGEQSCLNLLAILSPDTTRGFEVYGESDERYKVVGGNERIITELGQRLKSPVQTGFHLERMVQKSSGYQLSFANGRQTEVDYVVMTLPFSVLRTIQFEMPISARKRQCIQELGYGTVSKLFIGVTERVWRRDGYSGIAISDQIQNGWDSSHMQQANTGPGGYTLLLGGEQGRRLTINQFDSYLAGCNQVFSGMNQATNGQKNLYNWTANPLARGAYACYKVGQVTTIGRAEGERAGNVLFAGEHCSRRFQGYMNGAAETGRRAAEDIATELGVSSFQSVRREKVSG